MNQVHPTKAFGPTPETPAAKPVLKPDQNLRVRLTHGDARALHAVLIKGDDALAQRKDLGDLYKRVVTMISTLDTGLSERQASRADEIRTLLSTRLDRMEHSINEVEGVLRIEMEPLICAAVNDAIEDRLSQATLRARPSIRHRLLQILVLCTCLYVGSLFATQIEGLIDVSSGYLSELISSITAILSPDGGIKIAPVPVE